MVDKPQPKQDGPQLAFRAVAASREDLCAELQSVSPGALSPTVSRRLARLLGDRLPCSGTLRLRCPGCRATRAVAFRCMGECELCPRKARRRATALAQLIPRVPVRHWVLALPPWLRAYLARDDMLAAQVSRLFVRELFAAIRRVAGISAHKVHCGGVSLIHRAGVALNVNVHVHALVLDGVYTMPSSETTAIFHPLSAAPEPALADALVRRVLKGIRVLLSRRMSSGALPMSNHALQKLEKASIYHRVATGPRAGASVRRVRAARRRPGPPSAAAVRSERDGVRVHGGRQVKADEREAVLRLSRYLTRPPVDLGALESTPTGRLRYALAHPFSDGTTHVELAPQELAEKLVALIPDGATHRVSYHGVLAPRAAHRWRVLPTQLVLIEQEGGVEAGRRRPRSNQGTHGLLICDVCDQAMEVIAVDEAVDDPG